METLARNHAASSESHTTSFSGFKSKRHVAASVGDIRQQVYSRLGMNNTATRTLDRISNVIGHAERGEVCHRSRAELARGLRVGSGSTDSQLRQVSRLLSNAREAQKRAGKELVTIFAGNPEEAPSFCDHIAPLVDEADSRRRRDPRWREGVAGKRAATAEIVEWVIENLPESEPPRDERPKRELTFSEEANRWRNGMKAGAEGLALATDREGFDERELRATLRAGARELLRIEASLRRTEPARRGVAFSGNNYESQESRCQFLSPPSVTQISDEIEAESGSDEGLFSRPENEGGGPDTFVRTSGLNSNADNAEFCENAELETEEPERGEPIEEALLAVKLFESVGASEPLEVILLDDSTKVARRVIKAPSRSETREKLAGWLSEAERERASLILRMTGTGEGRSRSLIQIDDCDGATVELLRPVAFMVIETSRENFQCWLSIEGCDEAELIALRGRLFERLGAKANGGAYGSLRWAGSVNFKPNREQFRVRLAHSARGRRVTEAELIERGILRPRSVEENATVRLSAQRREASVTHSDWLPDYDVELRRFGGDRSRADASFSGILLRSGRSEGETISLLKASSAKAASRRDSYAARTVARVAAKVRG